MRLTTAGTLVVLALPWQRLTAQTDSVVPDLAPLIAQPVSEMRPVLERWNADRGALGRRYSVEYSPQREQRYRSFYAAWRARLAALPFDRLSRSAQIDYILLDNRIRNEQALVDRDVQRAAEMATLLPFADTLDAMLEQRRRMVRPDPARAAAEIAWMTGQLDSATARLGTHGAQLPSRIVAYRAADAVAGLHRQFQGWSRFYLGYDPAMTWWVAVPAKKFETALDAWRKFLREKIVGARPGEDEPIVGDPIGADGLAADLRAEMIDYTPAELITLAEHELAYLQGEARKASREMGFGDDWKAALEKVKNDYPPVGEQTTTVRDMIREAITFVKARDFVTVPPLITEVIRMEMMSAEAQKTNPFFLGGEVIQVSSPTDDMSDDEKLMSLRANNIPMSRATAFHEMIPGHALQGFIAARSNPYRQMFSTPFYVEGWALWWEMHLWDLGFERTPEERMGALFWRMHRAGRIIFSLRFHLGEWTPQQCIDFLVDSIGHERASATGEVRRSFNGNYSPLYQAGYLLGGMQLRSLYNDLVGGHRMTEKQFHDAVLAAGPMPIEMIRAVLEPGIKLNRDYTANWRFAGN
ncbi:MAG: DUF885 family protein [Gemmatimonadales bacterium]